MLPRCLQVKLWNVWKSECVETLEPPSDVLCVAWRPDGKQLTAGTLHGQLHLWDPEEGDELGTIDGQRDIAGGRGLEDRATAATSAARRHFSSVCYSADGSCVLAGGRSRFVCIYETTQQILLKKFQVRHSLLGVERRGQVWTRLMAQSPLSPHVR